MGMSEQKLKMMHDELNSVIFSLYMQNRLSEQEFDFLTRLLEIVITRNQLRDLVGVVRAWTASNTSSDIDDIIKATLLNINLADKQDVLRNVKVIKELLSARDTEFRS